MLSSSAPAVGYVKTSTRPPSRTGARFRWARTASAGRRGTGIRVVSSRVAARRAAPERRPTVRALTRAPGKADPKSRVLLMSAPRKA